MAQDEGVLEQEMDSPIHMHRCSTSQRIILLCIIHEMHIIASIMIAVTQTHTHTHRQKLCIQNVFACHGRGNPRIHLCICVCVDDSVFVGIPLLC